MRKTATMDTNTRNLVVRQSNSLIEASYKIPSVGEGRLIRMLIAQISPADEDFKTYRISVSDFAKFFGLSGGSAYDLIKKAADELAGRRIMLENGKSWLRLNWLSSAEYREGNGYIELRFDGKLKPYLLKLQTHWKQYALESIINFKSSYSIRIFELLKVEEFKADPSGYFRKSFEYDELREILGIGKVEYGFFKDFRVNVVEVSIREINANPDIHIIQVDYPKTGRKVSHIVFHCEKAKQTQLVVDEPEPKLEEVRTKEPPDDVRELVALGIEEATAYKWRKKYGVRQVVRNIAYTQAMKRAGKIRDSLTGFLARAIADNLGGGWEAELKEKEKRRKDAEAKEAQAQANEDSKRNAERVQRDTLMAEFHSLQGNEQEYIRRLYETQANTTALATWNKVKKSNPTRPEDSNSAKMDFLMFFKTYKANLRLDL
jgi:plasmid replication initiation protein